MQVILHTPLLLMTQLPIQTRGRMSVDFLFWMENLSNTRVRKIIGRSGKGVSNNGFHLGTMAPVEFTALVVGPFLLSVLARRRGDYGNRDSSVPHDLDGRCRVVILPGGMGR